MTKHTPGPWIMAPDEPAAIYSKSAYINAKDDRIALVNPDFGCSNWIANARLIAAAPDMLQSLKDIVLLADADESLDADELWSKLGTIIKYAEQAIVQATGEKP